MTCLYVCEHDMNLQYWIFQLREGGESDVSSQHAQHDNDNRQLVQYICVILFSQIFASRDM